jgi:hypothetical protein
MTGSHLREGLLREYSGVNNPPSLYDPVAGALGGGGNGLIPMAGQGYSQDDINALKDRLGTPGDPRATTGIVQVTTPGSGNTQVSVMAQEGARSGATNGPTPPPKPGQSDNPAPASDEAKGNGSTRINYGTGTGPSSGVIDFDQEVSDAMLADLVGLADSFSYDPASLSAYNEAVFYITLGQPIPSPPESVSMMDYALALEPAEFEKFIDDLRKAMHDRAKRDGFQWSAGEVEAEIVYYRKSYEYARQGRQIRAMLGQDPSNIPWVAVSQLVAEGHAQWSLAGTGEREALELIVVVAIPAEWGVELWPLKQQGGFAGTPYFSRTDAPTRLPGDPEIVPWVGGAHWATDAAERATEQAMTRKAAMMGAAFSVVEIGFGILTFGAGGWVLVLHGFDHLVADGFTIADGQHHDTLTTNTLAGGLQLVGVEGDNAFFYARIGDNLVVPVVGSAAAARLPGAMRAATIKVGIPSSPPTFSGGNVTYFRVQGGIPPNASRQLIHVDSAGNLTIHSGTLNVSTGTAQHARYFQQLRGPGSRITTFEIPQWLDDFIRQEAIKQYGYRTNPLNQGRLAPKIVDPRQPGRSYELPRIWAEWLKEYAIPGSGRVLD